MGEMGDSIFIQVLTIHLILDTNEINRKIDSMIDDIRQKIATGQYEYSKHAVDQTIKRRIAVQDVVEAIASKKSDY